MFVRGFWLILSVAVIFFVGWGIAEFLERKDADVKATLAVDAFNVLNEVNYSSFIGNLSSPFFGQAVASQPPRRLQFSFRLKF